MDERGFRNKVITFTDASLECGGQHQTDNNSITHLPVTQHHHQTLPTEMFKKNDIYHSAHKP